VWIPLPARTAKAKHVCILFEAGQSHALAGRLLPARKALKLAWVITPAGCGSATVSDSRAQSRGAAVSADYTPANVSFCFPNLAQSAISSVQSESTPHAGFAGVYLFTGHAYNQVSLVRIDYGQTRRSNIHRHRAIFFTDEPRVGEALTTQIINRLSDVGRQIIAAATSQIWSFRLRPCGRESRVRENGK